MERYEFMATTATSDRIIGLIFPMMLMLPILGLQLALFYFNLNHFFCILFHSTLFNYIGIFEY